MESTALYDLSPALRMMLFGAVLALGPLAWIWLRNRNADTAQRLRALTWVTLFLTFDLVLFGAFTRLTDSGLGCPDWPGCYGSASPLGAQLQISAAQEALPSGPVTHGKAWVEMVHRYLATAVGALILVMTVVSWMQRRKAALRVGPSPWWATVTLVWVCIQGAFGALTVTMKLYPAIVTLHLLGGMLLLALLAAQAQAFAPRPLALPRAWLWGSGVLLVLCLGQMALGAWVSTNYAVLACTDFPTCQGQWWPPMDFEHAFVLRRELGVTQGGDYLPFAALTAIHVVHRLGALMVLPAMVWLGVLLRRRHDARVFGSALIALAAWQLLSGLSNVVLDWPLIAAVAHTGGAAALTVLLTVLLTRALQAVDRAR